MSTKVKISRFQQQKERYESNRQYIQTTLELTDLVYCTAQFELGLKFIQIHCQKTANETPESAKRFMDISRDDQFWVWWKSEWSVIESKMISNYSSSDIKLDFDMWLVRMTRCCWGMYVVESFYHNYLRRTPPWRTNNK